MGRLTGKVAVVTGASKGIGAGIAQALAAEGASVVVNYASSKAGAEKVVAAITAAGGKAVAAGGDVSKAVDAKGIIDAAIKNYGRLDILVNNSGVYEFAPLEAVTEETFHKTFNINVLGTILTTQAAVKHMSNGGSIINIGSAVSRLTPPNSVVYTASKGALDAVTGVLARELGPKKIRVNTINPGIVETEGTQTGGFLAPSSRRLLLRVHRWDALRRLETLHRLQCFWRRTTRDTLLASSSWLLGEFDRSGATLRIISGEARQARLVGFAS